MLFCLFRNDMERNERRLEQKQPHLFYCLRHCPEPFLRYVSGNIYGTYRLYTMAVLWILFFSFYAAQSLPGKNRRFLAWVVIATVAVETVLGIAQSIGLLENSDPQFIIGGSMTNPGAYAGYLGVTAPLILSLLVSYKKTNGSRIFATSWAGFLS